MSERASELVHSKLGWQSDTESSQARPDRGPAIEHCHSTQSQLNVTAHSHITQSPYTVTAHSHSTVTHAQQQQPKIEVVRSACTAELAGILK